MELDGTLALIWSPCVTAYFYPLAYRILTRESVREGDGIKSGPNDQYLWG